MIRICIPSYNRWSRLGVQLRQLEAAKLLGANVTVDVFDNASTDETSGNFGKEAWPEGFVMHRFESNIGYEGNVCRILDYAVAEGWASDYLWILGDDDFVNPVAVAKLSRLELPPTPILLRFVRWGGASLGFRPAGEVPSGALKIDELFAILNDSTLISCWMYPVSILADITGGVWRELAENQFLQVVLTACALRAAGGMGCADLSIGIEYPAVGIRWNTRKTWAVDRPIAISAACDVLNIPSSYAAKATARIAQSTFKQALGFALMGRQKAFNDATEAIDEFLAGGQFRLRVLVRPPIAVARFVCRCGGLPVIGRYVAWRKGLSQQAADTLFEYHCAAVFGGACNKINWESK